MSSERLEDVFARIQRRVNDGLFPGATALVARHGAVVGHRAFGNKVAGVDDPVTLDTIFDLRSMTKVLSTAASALAPKGWQGPLWQWPTMPAPCTGIQRESRPVPSSTCRYRLVANPPCLSALLFLCSAPVTTA
jgi:hypothetical protein